MFVPSALRRPKRFEDVVGQNVTVRILRAAVEQRRLATSYTFTGPSGVGKTTVARLFAAALSCKKPDPPCGSCNSCADVAECRSEDVVEIDAASDRGVEMVSNLQDTVNILLPEDTWRVVILDEAHQLSNKAWGAFLKTIEEPPPRNVFIFVTTEREKIPATVKGRSSPFVFRSIPDDAVEAFLQRFGLDAEEGVLQVISREANGSLRDALQMLDQLALLGENVSVKAAEDLVGVSSDVVRELADGVISKSVAGFLTVIESLTKQGQSPEHLSRILGDISRDFYLVRIGWNGPLRSRLSRGGIQQNTKHLSDDFLLDFFLDAAKYQEGYVVSRLGIEALYARLLRKA